MKIYSADWILPITSPKIRNGAAVISDENKILDVAPADVIQKKYSDKNIQNIHFRNSVLMPGLVNAHTHLELSMMKGVVPGGLDFGDWVFEAVTKRFQFDEEEVIAACRNGVAELERTGTAAVGDIANHSAISFPLLQASKLFAVIFNEATGLAASVAPARFEEFKNKCMDSSRGRDGNDNPEAGRITHALAPHAPYSVSPELFRLIADFNNDGKRVSSVHLAESSDETELIRDGGGKLKAAIVKMNRWNHDWIPPGTSPVKYLDQLGFLDDRLIAVHVVHADHEDIALLKSRGVNICTCPRSNVKINAGGAAPVENFLKAGLNVCIGTDSFASNDDLNLWNEMAFLKKMHPDISDAIILEMATVNGARALGFQNKIGSIEAGKENRLIAVKSCGVILNPESFLLSGYENFSAVEWL